LAQALTATVKQACAPDGTFLGGERHLENERDADFSFHEGHSNPCDAMSVAYESDDPDAEFKVECLADVLVTRNLDRATDYVPGAMCESKSLG
jgi:hypothetical protein